MIAMQYVFTLPADYDMSRIVERVRTKGPSFDQTPGLLFKTFLISEAGKDGARENRYAPFYVWHTPEAMAGFLAGPGFKALVASFGRPSIRTWLPVRATAPSASVATLDIAEEAVPDGTDLAILADRNGDVVGLNPTDWRLVRVTFDAAGAPEGSRYRVLHLSMPAQR